MIRADDSLTGTAPGADETLASAGGRARLVGFTALLERLLHDLKQPLNLIRIIAQGVRIDERKGRLDRAELPPMMTEIEGAVDALVGRIDQLRTFVRPDRCDAANAAADVAGVCRAAVARIRDAYPRLQVAETIAADLPAAVVDALAFEQSLWEVLDNAARAAAEAPAEGRVDLDAVQRGAEVAITVRDNGRGIPTEALPRVFEPFFSLRPGAAGLGLATALAVVKEAHGTLRCSETSGAGSTFELRLPLRT